MKWESLLVLLFLLLPVIQGILEQVRKAPPPPAPPGDGPRTPADAWEEWLAKTGQLPRPDPAAQPIPVPVADGRPMPERKARHRPEEPPAPEVRSLEAIAPRPVRAEAAVDDTNPNREAEHLRFRRKLAESTAPRVSHAESRLRLRGIGELRRAVLLAEVLGPPRALRPVGDGDR